MPAEAPAGEDLGLDLAVAYRRGAQHDAPVGDEDAMARLHVVGQIAVGDREPLAGAGLVPCGDDDGGAGCQFRGLAAGQRPGAQARALDVLEQPDRPSFGLGERADPWDGVGDLLVCGVGEVQAEEVDAGGDEAAQHLLRGHRRAPGRYDLREPSRICHRSLPRVSLPLR